MMQSWLYAIGLILAILAGWAYPYILAYRNILKKTFRSFKAESLGEEEFLSISNLFSREVSRS